jgi:predicted nuclease of predicted toxin-antitoxin system
MRFKLDENMPARLASVLHGRGLDVHTTVQEGLSGHPDAEVFEKAQSEGRFLITQDLDFSDARRFEPGAHAGILLVRLREPGRGSLLRRVEALFETESVKEDLDIMEREIEEHCERIGDSGLNREG